MHLNKKICQFLCAKKAIGLILVALLWFMKVYADEKPIQRTPGNYILTTPSNNSFQIANKGQNASILVDASDWKGVIRAANDLGADIGRVTGTNSIVKTSTGNMSETGAIVVGTIGKSRLIDQLISNGKLKVSDIKGQLESFVIQTIDNMLVVAGTDKRGTIYGIYDISEKIGVSPWYWWADVPARKSAALFVKNGRFVQDPPKVKYRGIFINDESPSMASWCRQFGGFNSKMYTHMFELLLRLKANYLWPAMWGKTFNEEDPMSPLLADEYGIIMGTSHHEPMMRAQQEYTNRSRTVGPWDYVTNKARLDIFWFEGVNRNKAYDNVITIGMRGDGDVAMGKGNDQENINTLRDVIKGQREIIEKAYGKSASEVPQLWAIFTEVQRYYDAGMSVPEDVLLLFCDNNWGYIRRVEPQKEKGRKGGSGLYYHIDMNGGPWNDRWVNTTTIPKLREQFNLAYQSGLDDLWIINVGDLKPKEFPIDFILRYAWNPDNYPADKVSEYTLNWAKQNFGDTYATEIADIVSKYSKYNLIKKAEVQTTRIYSYVNHHEADKVLNKWKAVVEKAESIYEKIDPAYKDAYYQLVLYPAKASAGVAEMYISCGLNNLYAKQGRVSANDYAKRAEALFELDKQLSDYYNNTMSNGKWKGMMSDIHIGYTAWSMPRANKLPDLNVVNPLSEPTMGIAVEGSELSWPSLDSKTQPTLPTFDAMKKNTYYIDIFNRGNGAFTFDAKADKPWIILSTQKGTVEKELRLVVDIDWKKVPKGSSTGTITIQDGKGSVSVKVNAQKADLPKTKEAYFGNLTGEFSIPANQYNKLIPGKNATWITLPDLGRDEACMGFYPVTAPIVTNLDEAATLEYQIFVPKAGKTTVLLGILPIQDIHPETGLSIGIALNKDKPIILDARQGLHDEFKEYTKENLAKSLVLKALPPLNRNIAQIGAGQTRRNEVFDNQRWLDVELDVKTPGLQTLKIMMVHPEVVLERIIVNPDNQYPSYFGSPSQRHNSK